MDDWSASRALLIAVCVLLGLAAVAVILVIALEPHRHALRRNCTLPK